MSLYKYAKLLENHNSHDFADWLTCGFKDINNKNKAVLAFAPLNYFVRRRGDLIEELKDIFDCLSGDAQKKFCKGIAIALANLSPTNQSIYTIRALLHLSGRLHATEILPIVVQQIGNGYFGMPNYDHGPSLFALTLDIVGGLSPSDGVTDTLNRLVTCEFFRDGYAPMTFIALCRANPENYPDHLLLLRNCFTKLHKEKGMAGAHLTAQRFVNYVDLKTIAHNLFRVKLSNDPNILSFSNDNWLFDTLFLGQLLLRKSLGVFYIARTGGREHILKNILMPFENNTISSENIYHLRTYLEGWLESNWTPPKPSPEPIPAYWPQYQRRQKRTYEEQPFD